MSFDNIDSVRPFHGNGAVYVTDRNRVRAFEQYNFNVESLRPKSHGEYWVTDEVIVALGCDVLRKRALKALRHVAERIESEMAKGAAIQIGVVVVRMCNDDVIYEVGAVCVANEFCNIGRSRGAPSHHRRLQDRPAFLQKLDRGPVDALRPRRAVSCA